ncbi:MAG: 30S ribosomal protein S8 [Gammaproteobacteria bacterium]|nr:30S ribosomal protein S8 [Gammaproteobacteria bacterium]MCY4181850.1 30S ribosomal protein S8 [Gammaproteobacteria bacterium]MCY4269116.1 30S ribosomal protein S8 [Gammaproteobacteria bacterium]MCY4295984.1 30S ribosomal protein S8 [Gammaproteobacteria bacterium]
MTMTDPIADYLTRIRNAQMAKLETVRCPASKIKLAISGLLLEEGYIAAYQVHENAGKPEIEVALKYVNGTPAIEEIKRVSRPGLRAYRGRDEIPSNRAGLGTVILSTNLGLMTDKKARAQGIGGEVICTVF